MVDGERMDINVQNRRITALNSNRNDNKPNILLIHCHDLGTQLGCYGHHIETPHIDSLFDNGIKFDNYFSAAPMCSPSRSSAITGKYPVNHGVMGQAHFGWKLKEGMKTIPMLMNEAGYDTHLFGLQHESTDPAKLGYTHVNKGFPHVRGYAPDVARDVVDFLDSRNHDQPFYANIGFQEVHRWIPTGGYENWVGTEAPNNFRPIYVSQDAKSGYTDKDCILRVSHPEDVNYFRAYTPDEVLPPPYLPDRPGIREDIAEVQDVITCVVDVMVGKILQKLKEKGLEDNTLVIFSTDHGLDMPRTKGTLYDAGLNIALIMRYPRWFKEKGKVFTELLSNVDLLPTLVEIAGLEPPEDIDGKSFLPLITGDPYRTREYIRAEMTWHGKYVPMRAIRTNTYKYIRNFHLREANWIVVPESKAAREVLGKYQMVFCPIEELYDLEHDPYEQVNLASEKTMFSIFLKELHPDQTWPPHPGYVEAIKTFRSQLRNWMELTKDPLLDGPVPTPGYKHIWDEFDE